MTQVVYFVASHVHPPQVVRLVRALRSGGPASRVVINHAFRVSHLDAGALAHIDRVHFLEPQRSPAWGDFSMTRMVLEALDWITQRFDPDWVVYLSGQDYPIRPLPEIEEFLATTSYDGFVAGRRIDRASEANRELVERYCYRYRALPRLRGGAYLPRLVREAGIQIRHAWNRLQPLVKVRAWDDRLRLGLPVRRLPVGDRPLYKGSAWWTLSRRAVAYLRRFLAEHPAVVRHYARTFAAGESFWATILRNAETLRICDDNYRYIRWIEGHAHPEILTLADLEPMRISGKHFARKFDMTREPRLLDCVDRLIGCARGPSP